MKVEALYIELRMRPKHPFQASCGGMLESGIGRAHIIVISALPNFVLPANVSASQHSWEDGIIEPEAEVTPHATIRVSQAPSPGFTAKHKPGSSEVG